MKSLRNGVAWARNAFVAGKNQNSQRKIKRTVFVILLSVIVIFLTLQGTSSPLMSAWERISVDLRMRLRCRFSNQGNQWARPDITVLALDNDTLARFGKLGAGQWAARKPYFDQLHFFGEYFRPSVLAYDIVFRDSLGEEEGRGRKLSGSPEDLLRISGDMNKLAKEGLEAISSSSLVDLALFTAEQGDVFLVHRLASIDAGKLFPVIIGYYFKGGWNDPQSVTIPPWSRNDICGNDPSGNEGKGEKLPYLMDVSIPSQCIHFSSDMERRYYGYAPNATFPVGGLIDYSMLGFLNGQKDDDGIIRRIPLVLGFRYKNPVTGEGRKEVFVPSFALQATMLHMGIKFPLSNASPPPLEVFFGKEIILRTPKGDRRIPIDEKGCMYLNFRAGFNKFNTISFVKVAPSYLDTTEKERDAIADRYKKVLNGHVVLVGAVATGLGDVGATPLSSQTPLVHVHTTVVNSILSNTLIRQLTRHEEFLLAISLFVLFTTVCFLRRISWFAGVSFVCMSGYLVISYALLNKDWLILPVIWPSLYMALCFVAVLVFRYFESERQRHQIRGMFSTMVSKDVLTYLERHPDSFSLNGRNTDVTVMMSDLAGFSTISERLAPETVTKLINSYFGPMADCIMKHGGYVDKYMGDGIMAIWGAPFSNPNHALEACHCAIEQCEILDNLNLTLKKEFGLTLDIRIGMNSGVVVAGTFGSGQRQQYSVIGHTANMAARLEPLNTDYGSRLIIGESTQKHVAGRVVTRKLDNVIVKGMSEPVCIYELVGLPGKVPEEVLQRIAVYEKAFDLYVRRKWNEAVDVLRTVPKNKHDKAILFLEDRIQDAKVNSPLPTWRGERLRKKKD